MAKDCIQCDERLRDEAKFCSHCGSAQPQDESVPPTMPDAEALSETRVTQEQSGLPKQEATVSSPSASGQKPSQRWNPLMAVGGVLALLVFSVLIVSALRGGEGEEGFVQEEVPTVDKGGEGEEGFVQEEVPTVDIEDFPAAIKELLPESYVSENERLTFRYPTDWTLQEVRQPGETINILHISNKPAGFSGKPNEIGIAISEPVYIMEKSKILDYSNASTQEVLEAYVRHEAGEDVLKYANPPLEVTLGDRPAVLWNFDLEEFDLIWLGFRSVDNMVNLMSIAVSNGEFEKLKPTVLAIAETFNYLAPSPNLDEPERTVQSYIRFVQQGDMDGALGLLCSTDRVMLDILNELASEANDDVVDVMELASTILSIAPAFSQMDTSNLYYESVFLDEEEGQAVVRVSGHVIITTNNGREAIRYSKFNILGRDWLKLAREDRLWKLCDSQQSASSAEEREPSQTRIPPPQPEPTAPPSETLEPVEESQTEVDIPPTEPPLLYVKVDLYAMDGATPISRDVSTPVITISGEGLSEPVSFEVERRSPSIQLAAGKYTIRVEAPPYEATETTFTLSENGQELPITMSMAPLDIEKMVLLDGTLINYETGAIVQERWPRGTVLFRADNPSKFILGTGDRFVSTSNYRYTPYFIDGRPDKRLSLPDDSSTRNQRDIRFDSDLKRGIYSHNNDLWLADVDWDSNQLLNARRVTQVGIFDNNFARSSFYWHGDYVLSALHNTVRIDLNSGEVKESPVYHLKIDERISPDHQLIAQQGSPLIEGHQEAFYIYDLVNDTYTNLLDSTSIGAYYWLTNNRLLLFNDGGSRNGIWIFEREENNIYQLTNNVADISGELYGGSPTGKYFFSNSYRNFSEYDVVLFSAETGQIVAKLPQVDNQDKQIEWATEDSFLFSRGARGTRNVTLEERGTWLYHVTTSDLTLISAFPYTSIVTIPENNVAVFLANDNLWRVNLDGTNLTQLTTTGTMRGQLSYPKVLGASPTAQPTAEKEVKEEVTPVTPSVEPTSVGSGDGYEARIDLKTFSYVTVRNLDSNTTVPYEEVARIHDTQTPVTALARTSDGTWIYVRLQDGTLGWIASEFVLAAQPLEPLPLRTPAAPPEIRAHIDLKTFEFINVRSGPSKSYGEISQLNSPNTYFMALGLSQDAAWVFVRLEDGSLGWVSREFVVSDSALEPLPRRLP